MTAQALLFDSDDKKQRMQAFLDSRARRREERQTTRPYSEPGEQR